MLVGWEPRHQKKNQISCMTLTSMEGGGGSNKPIIPYSIAGPNSICVGNENTAHCMLICTDIIRGQMVIQLITAEK